MPDTKDHRECHGADSRREREQPCRGRRRPRDLLDRLQRRIRRQPAGLDIPDRLHGGHDTIHVNAGRIRSPLRHEVGSLVLELELHLPPAQQHLGAQSDRPPQSLDRHHGLLRCLAVDEENPGNGENKFIVQLRCHASLSAFMRAFGVLN